MTLFSRSRPRSALENPSAALLSGFRAPTLGERIIEDRGGLIFSVALHVVLASFWFRQQWRRPAPPAGPEFVKVRFAPPPPPPAEPLPESLAPAAASATESVPDAETFEMERPADSDLDGEAPENPAEAPPSAEREALEEMRRSLAEMARPAPAEAPSLSASERRVLEAARQRRAEREQELEKKIAAASMRTAQRRLESKGRELQLASGGAKDGVVRSLELRGVPQGILDRVLFKNGLEILHVHLEPGFQSKSPIGAAVTDQGVYAASEVTRAGVYEVVNISARAMAKIARLERAYLESRRLNPKSTQMISVTYGVANLGGNKGYDLVILQADHRSIE